MTNCLLYPLSKVVTPSSQGDHTLEAADDLSASLPLLGQEELQAPPVLETAVDLAVGGGSPDAPVAVADIILTYGRPDQDVFEPLHYQPRARGCGGGCTGKSRPPLIPVAPRRYLCRALAKQLWHA